MRLRDVAAGRRKAAARNNDIGAQLLARFDSALSVKSGTVVSGYWPINDEANVMNLLVELGGRGAEMALPVVTPRGQPLIFRRWHVGAPMGSGPFGISEPDANAALLSPDCMLIPLLGFDRSGARLGYGGGYYDRTIAKLRAEKPVVAVGIAYAAQEFDAVPCGPTDVPLDWVVTESEAIKIGDTER